MASRLSWYPAASEANMWPLFLGLTGCFTFTGVENRAPTVERVVVHDPAPLEAGLAFASTVACEASDPEDDALTFEWLPGSGSTVSDPYVNPTVWELEPPPVSGEFTIQCVASDGRWSAYGEGSAYRP